MILATPARALRRWSGHRGGWLRCGDDCAFARRGGPRNDAHEAVAVLAAGRSARTREGEREALEDTLAHATLHAHAHAPPVQRRGRGHLAHHLEQRADAEDVHFRVGLGDDEPQFQARRAGFERRAHTLGGVAVEPAAALTRLWRVVEARGYLHAGWLWRGSGGLHAHRCMWAVPQIAPVARGSCEG